MKKFLLSMLLAALALTGVYASTNEVLRVDFENGLPSGWTQEHVQLPVTQSGSPALYSWSVEVGDSLTYPAGCVSGTHRMKAANTTNQEMRFITRLVTPQINLTGVFRPQLVFWHAEPARAAFSDTLRVYYRTSATDYWHLLPNAEYTRNGKWQEQTINLISTNSTYQVAFEISESMGRGVVLDDVVFRSMPTCEDVSNIICSSIHAYDVTLSWDAFGAYNEFQVMVADEALDLQNINPSHIVANLTEGVYDPSTVVTGLQPETTYYVYVRSDCDENDSGFTNWVSTSFRTLKVAYLPYEENFNSAIPFEGNIAYGMPDGWMSGNSFEDEVATPFVIRNNTLTNRSIYSVDSTAYLNFLGEVAIAATPVPASEYVYAVTPQIVAESLQGLQVSFWLTAAKFVSLGVQNYASELIVGTISDPLNFNTFHPIQTVKIGVTDMFKHVTVSLDNYSGSDKFIALASNADEANALFIDNFKMSVPEAPVPAEVKLTNVHSTGFTVQPSLHGAALWDVVVSSEYVRDGNVRTSIVQQNNISAASYNVESTDLTNQIVFVYTRTHKGNATSAWSFAKAIRVPGKMPEITDEASYTESFESGNTLSLNTLEQENRLAASFRGISSVYFPLQAVDATINTYPLCVSTQPNYRGSHAQLCGIDSWFVLPETDSINTLKTIFRYASHAEARGKLAVGVMTDPYDLSTFTQMAEFEVEGKTYQRCLVSFDNYTGAGKYIAFRSLNAGSGVAASTNLIDEIIVSKLGRCREASNVQINPHAEYAEVTWNGGGMDAWIVGLSTQKNMLNATYTTVTTPSVEFNDLDQQTTYYITIQTICGNDTLPLDDVRYTFRTPRGLPIAERFSGGIPAGWTQSSTQASLVFAGAEMGISSGLWKVTNEAAYVNSPMSGFVAYRSLYQTTNTKYGWLISPELYVDAAPDKPLELVFDLGMATYATASSSYTYGEAGANDVFIVAVSEDGGNTWQRKNSFVWDNKGTGNRDLNSLIWDGGERIRLDFTPYIGKRIKFAFYLETSTTNHHDNLVIDNVILREGDDRCGGLTGLSAYAPSVNSATVTWQLAGINPWPAVVQLSTNAAFATLLANDTIQGNTKSYSNLEPNTVYHIQARQLCQNDAEWKRTTFRTPCMAITPEAFGTETFDGDDAIGCWATGFLVENTTGTLPRRARIDKFGGVLQLGKFSVDTTAADGAYAITPELNLDDNVKDITHYQVVFRAGTNSSSDKNVHRLAVGIVTDPTDVSYTWRKQAEIDLQYAEDSTELKTYVVSFENYTGDFDGYMGHYIMFYSEAGTDSMNYILIDDVMITDIDGCRMVIDLAADSLAQNGVRLRWSGNAPRYEVGVSADRVDPAICDTWMYYDTVAGNTCFVSGLEATTKYYAYIRALCDEENVSRWSSATMFQTARGVPYLETFDAVVSSMNEVDFLGASKKFTGDSVVITTYSSAWTPQKVGTNASTYNTITGMEGVAAYINIYGTSCYKWLITPAFDLRGVGDYSVRLSAKVALSKWSNNKPPTLDGSDDRLGVIISRDGGKTWRKRDATFWASDGSGKHPYNFGLDAQRIEVDLSDYLGDSIAVAFYGESLTSNDDNSLFIDSVRLEKFSKECMGVRNATLNLTGDTRAVAHWSIIGKPKEVVYEWSDVPDFATVLLTDTTSADSLAFADLALDRTYYLRLTQAGCENSAVLSVNTPHTIPFAESFAAANLPAEWTVYQGNADSALAGKLPVLKNTTQAWTISNKSTGLPANHLLGVLRNASNLKEMWYVSPTVIIPEGSVSVKLMFNLAYTARNSSNPPASAQGQEFRVLVSGDRGNTWTTSWLFMDTPDAYMQLSDVSATGMRIELPMDDFIGQAVRIAFYKTATANENEIHIANVQLREVGAPCATPTELAISNISFNGADVSWEGQEDKISIIEYSTYPDFNVSQCDTLINTLTHSLSHLQTGTTYYVRVRQICGQNSISDYSNVVSFMTLIGLPYINPLTTLDKWTRYQSPVADGISGSRTLLTTNTGWKENSTASILGGPHIYCGNNSTNAFWVVSPAIDLSGQDPNANIRLSIDLALTKSYNKNEKPSATDYATTNKFYIAVSTDNGETFSAENVWEFSSSANAAFVYADIPIGSGDTYLMDFSRFNGQTIRIALVSFATKTAAINAANLNLDLAGSSCFGLSGISFADTDTATTITILPNDTAHQWQLAYGLHGTDLEDMQMLVVNATSVHLGGLSLNSTYDVYGRSICAAEDTSAWFGPYSFDTPTGVPYTAAFAGAFDNWMRYVGDPDAIFQGTDSLKPSTSGWQTTTVTSYALGKPHIYCSQSSTLANWLVSPTINLMPQDGSTGIWLSLRAALTTSSTSSYAPVNVADHTFRIAYSLDNGATWREANSILWGDDTTKVDYLYRSIPNGAGKSIHLNVTEMAGREVRIALIEGAAPSGSSCIHIADFELAEYDVPCFGVENFTVELEGNIAHCVISDPFAESTAWQYVYGESGFTPSGANAVTTLTKKFDIRDLPMSSDIDIYVRTLCGENNLTAWVGPMTVTTPLGIPFHEALDESSMPTGWQSQTVYSGNWYVGSSKKSYVWGTNHAYINIYSNYKARLVSPEIALVDLGTNVELAFDLALTDYNNGNPIEGAEGQSFYVEISTDGGETFEPIAVWGERNADYDYASIPTTGERYHIDLSEFIGESIRLGFYAEATYGSGGPDNDLHIRNVDIDTIPTMSVPCARIRKAEVLERDLHSAKLIFRGSKLEEALSFEYVCLPENSIFNANLAVSTDTNVVVIKGLDSSNGYELFVRAQCADSTWGGWQGPYLFYTVECSDITGVTPLSVTNTDAVLRLETTNPGAAIAYQAYFCEEGEPLLLREIQTFHSDTVIFTQPISSSSIYHLYARKICEAGDTSVWCGPFAVQTPLGVPYYERLSGYSSLPAGWSCVTYNSSGAWTSSSSWSMSKGSYVWGENHAAINIYSSNNSMIVTPELSTSGVNNTLLLSFDLALTKWNTSTAPTTTAGQSFEVRVSTDGGRSFDPAVAVFGSAPSANYQYADIPTDGNRYTIDLSPYAGQSVRIGFHAIATGQGADNDLHLREVLLDTTVVRCTGISRVQVERVTLNDATIAFEYADGETKGSAVIEVALDKEFTQLLVQDSVIGDPEYVLTGLFPSTTYFVRVANVCGGGLSLWSNTATFTTAYGVRYQEDFEVSKRFNEWTQSTSKTNDVFTSGKLTETTSGKWSLKTNNEDVFPTQHITMNIYSTNTGWAITPAIDLSDKVGQGLLLGFDLALCKWSGGGMPDVSAHQSFYVIVSEDGGTTWSSKDIVASWKPNGTGSNYNYYDLGIVPIRYILDMTPYAGKSIKIAFCAEQTESGGDNNIMIDNIDFNTAISVTYTDTICRYEDYDMHDLFYAAGDLELGDNNFRIISENFDKVTSVNIYVKDLPNAEVEATICEGEEFSGYGFDGLVATQSGPYSRYIERAEGCDSILTLNLTVIPKSRTVVEDTLCDGSVYEFKGKSYYHDVILVDTLSSALTGCDSIVTYYITFSGEAVSQSDVYAVICAGQRYRDELFSETETGVYIETTATINGCDSIVTLHLFVADAEGALYDTIKASQLPYIYDGRELIPADADKNDYSFKLESVNEGCEPTLYVHVDRTDAISNIVAENLEIAPNPVQVGETLNVLTDLMAGEFTATVYNAIGQEVYTVTEFTTVLPGLPASGIYMVRIQTGKNLYEGKVLVK